MIPQTESLERRLCLSITDQLGEPTLNRPIVPGQWVRVRQGYSSAVEWTNYPRDSFQVENQGFAFNGAARGDRLLIEWRNLRTRSADVFDPEGRQYAPVAISGNLFEVPRGADRVTVTVTDIYFSSIEIVPTDVDYDRAVSESGWFRIRPLTANRGTVTGKLFDDRNQNREFDPATEAPITGSYVYLDTNRNGRFDLFLDPASVTDNDGNYAFLNIRPGTYTVRQITKSTVVDPAQVPAPTVRLRWRQTNEIVRADLPFTGKVPSLMRLMDVQTTERLFSNFETFKLAPVTYRVTRPDRFIDLGYEEIEGSSGFFSSEAQQFLATSDRPQQMEFVRYNTTWQGLEVYEREETPGYFITDIRPFDRALPQQVSGAIRMRASTTDSLDNGGSRESYRFRYGIRPIAGQTLPLAPVTIRLLKTDWYAD
jgi:hypothetical protein